MKTCKSNARRVKFFLLKKKSKATKDKKQNALNHLPRMP